MQLGRGLIVIEHTYKHVLDFVCLVCHSSLSLNSQSRLIFALQNGSTCRPFSNFQRFQHYFSSCLYHHSSTHPMKPKIFFFLACFFAYSTCWKLAFHFCSNTVRCFQLLLVILIFYSMQTFSFRRHTTNTVRLNTDERDTQFYLLFITCDVILGKCLPSPSHQLTAEEHAIVSKVTQNPKLINILFAAVSLSVRMTGSMPCVPWPSLQLFLTCFTFLLLLRYCDVINCIIALGLLFRGKLLSLHSYFRSHLISSSLLLSLSIDLISMNSQKNFYFSHVLFVNVFVCQCFLKGRGCC